MKKITIFLVMAAFFFSSCKKESPSSYTPLSTTTAKPTEVVKTPAPDPTPVEPLSAKFSITVPDPQNIFENQQIQFTSLGKNIVSWVWQFGNGTKQYTYNPVASYVLHGFYNVTLTVTDKDGNTASSTQQVSILCNFLGGGHNPGS